MVAYFDEANLVSFFKQMDEHPFGNDVMSLLKKQLNLFFNFSLDSIPEELEIQLSEFTEGTGRNRDELNIQFSNKDIFENRPVTEVANPNGIYLLDGIEPKLLNSHLYLMSNVGDEIATLQKLIFDEYDSSLHEQRSITEADFKSWDEIIKYLKPFNSMIIVDRFMFSGSAIGGNLALFENNLKHLLSHSFELMQGQPRLIFIFQIKPNRFPAEMGPDSAQMIAKIVRAVKAKNRHCKRPEVALVYVANTIEDEHDRNIVSNYFRIKSGDTFVYFNAANEIITQSSDLDFYSLGKLQYRKTTNNLKQKLSEMIDEVQQNNPDRIKANFELNGHLINF
jgi:hypothetical protein